MSILKKTVKLFFLFLSHYAKESRLFRGGEDAATCHRFCFGVNFSLREFVQSEYPWAGAVGCRNFAWAAPKEYPEKCTAVS